MHARFLVLAFISSLGTACLIPVDVTPDDGGRGGGGGSGGGVGGGGGGAGCAPLEFSGTPSGSAAVIPLDPCRTVSVFAPDGSVEPTLSTGTEATFVPQAPGVYVVEVTQGGVTTRVPLPVDGALGGGLLRRYSDRIDRCDQMRFTSRQTLLCVVNATDQSHSTIFAYDVEGRLVSQFDTGVLGAIEVAGDDVWTLYGSAVEHRTDLGADAGLRFDGQVPAIGFRHLTDPLPGRVGVGNSAEDSSVFEVTWDGTSLDAGLRFPLIQTFAYPLILESATTLWSAEFCRIEAGCQNMPCPAVKTCDGLGRSVVGSHGPNVWVATGDIRQGGSTVRLMTRSLNPTPVTAERAVPVTFKNYFSQLGRGAVVVNEVGAGRSVLVPQNGSFFFAEAVQAISVTERFYVEYVDTFTLRFVSF